MEEGYISKQQHSIPLPKENGPILTSDGTVLFYPNLNQSPSPISYPYSPTRNSSPCLPYQQTSRQTRGEVSPSVLMSMTRESGRAEGFTERREGGIAHDVIERAERCRAGLAGDDGGVAAARAA